MKLSLDDLNEYGDDLNAIASEASQMFSGEMRRAFDEFIDKHGDISTWSREQRDEFRKLTTDIMVEYWDMYGTASSSLGSIFFEEMLDEEMPEESFMDDSVSRVRAEASARYWMGRLFKNPPCEDEFFDGCSSFVERNVSHSADKAVIDGAIELGKKGKHIKFGRVPVGPTCGFCIMLASRGFVYADKKSAGDEGGQFNRFHDNCNCRVVAGTEGLEVEGYDYEGMYRRYKSCQEVIGGLEQIEKDWDALPQEEKDKYGRRHRAMSMAEDPDEDARLRKRFGNQVDAFNDYMMKRIVQEMDTRDRRWVYDETALPAAEIEKGAKPKLKERKTEEKLRPAGYRMVFRKPTGDGRTSDVYFVSGSEDNPVYTKWEIKHSEGDAETRVLGKSNIRNQFKNARGQSRNLILDVEDVVGFIDTDGKTVDRKYLEEATRQALVHHEIAPWFDEAIIVFGTNDFLKIVKRKKEAR